MQALLHCVIDFLKFFLQMDAEQD